MLAEMACSGPLDSEPPIEEARETLRLMQRRRDRLVAMRQQERTRLREAVHPFERDSLTRHIAVLSQDVAAIERAMAQAIAAAPALNRLEARLRQVPGCARFPVSDRSASACCSP